MSNSGTLSGVQGAISETNKKLRDILDILRGRAFNNLTQKKLEDGAVFTFEKGKVHAYTFTVLSGSLDVKIGDDDAVTYPAGYTGNYEVTTTFSREIVLTSANPSLVVFSYNTKSHKD